MTTPSKTTDARDWQPVPPGTLTRLARRSAGRRGRRRALTLAAAACLAATTVWSAVGVAYLRLGAPDETGFEYAGIRCGEVRDLLPEYLAGTLPKDKAAQVHAHVTKCSICKDRVRRVREGLPVAVAAAPPLRIATPLASRRPVPSIAADFRALLAASQTGAAAAD